MVETIILAVVAAAPSITAIAGIFAAISKFCKVIAELKAEVTKTKEYDEVKTQLVVVHQENIELKKKLNELLITLDKVQRK